MGEGKGVYKKEDVLSFHLGAIQRALVSNKLVVK